MANEKRRHVDLATLWRASSRPQREGISQTDSNKLKSHEMEYRPAKYSPSHDGGHT